MLGKSPRPVNAIPRCWMLKSEQLEGSKQEEFEVFLRLEHRVQVATSVAQPMTN
jgi:hypothetical protein